MSLRCDRRRTLRCLHQTQVNKSVVLFQRQFSQGKSQHSFLFISSLILFSIENINFSFDKFTARLKNVSRTIRLFSLLTILRAPWAELWTLYAGLNWKKTSSQWITRNKRWPILFTDVIWFIDESELIVLTDLFRFWFSDDDWWFRWFRCFYYLVESKLQATN